MMRSLMLFSLCLLMAAVGLADPAIVVGKYTGTYAGAASGDIHMTLSQDESNAWKAEVSFTVSDQDVKTKITSLKVNGAKLEIVYKFDLQGTALQSTINGDLHGQTLQ